MRGMPAERAGILHKYDGATGVKMDLLPSSPCRFLLLIVATAPCQWTPVNSARWATARGSVVHQRLLRGWRGMYWVFKGLGISQCNPVLMSWRELLRGEIGVFVAVLVDCTFWPGDLANKATALCLPHWRAFGLRNQGKCLAPSMLKMLLVKELV